MEVIPRGAAAAAIAAARAIAADEPGPAPARPSFVPVLFSPCTSFARSVSASSVQSEEDVELSSVNFNDEEGLSLFNSNLKSSDSGGGRAVPIPSQTKETSPGDTMRGVPPGKSVAAASAIGTTKLAESTSAPKRSPRPMGIILDEDIEEVDTRMGEGAAGAAAAGAADHLSPGAAAAAAAGLASPMGGDSNMTERRLGTSPASFKRMAGSSGGGDLPGVGRPPLPPTPTGSSSMRVSASGGVAGMLERTYSGGGGGSVRSSLGSISSDFGDFSGELPGLSSGGSAAQQLRRSSLRGPLPPAVLSHSSSNRQVAGDNGSNPLEPESSRASMDSMDFSVEGSENSLSLLAPGGVKPPTAGGMVKCSGRRRGGRQSNAF